MAEKTLKFELDVIRNEPARNAASSGSTPQSSGKSGKNTMFGKAFSGVLKGLGIVSGIGLIAQIVGSFKPLLSMVGAILKLVGQFLRPIADVVMILLMPLLLLLKPLVFAIREIMEPFRKQAYAFLKRGMEKGGAADFGLASLTILAGVHAVITFLFSEILKLVFTLVLEVIASLIGFISPAAQEVIEEKVIPEVGRIIETLAVLFTAISVANILSLGQTVDGEMGTFISDVRGMLDSTYSLVSDEFLSQVEKALKTVKLNGLLPSIASLFKAAGIELIDAFKKIANALIEAIGLMIKALGEEIITGGRNIFDVFPGGYNPEDQKGSSLGKWIKAGLYVLTGGLQAEVGGALIKKGVDFFRNDPSGTGD